MLALAAMDRDFDANGASCVPRPGRCPARARVSESLQVCAHACIVPPITQTMSGCLPWTMTRRRCGGRERRKHKSTVCQRTRSGTSQGGCISLRRPHAGAPIAHLGFLATCLGACSSKAKAPTSSPGGSGKDSSATEDGKTCRVCLCEFEDGDSIRIIPCFHQFHQECIDRWLLQKAECPVCKAPARGNDDASRMAAFV